MATIINYVTSNIVTVFPAVIFSVVFFGAVAVLRSAMGGSR